MEATDSGGAEYQKRGSLSETEPQNSAAGQRGLLSILMKTKLCRYRVIFQEDKEWPRSYKPNNFKRSYWSGRHSRMDRLGTHRHWVEIPKRSNFRILAKLDLPSQHLETKLKRKKLILSIQLPKIKREHSLKEDSTV